MGMLVSFIVGSLSAFVVSKTWGNSGEGLELGGKVEMRSKMVASMRDMCKHGPAPVEHVYYGRLVLTVSGGDKLFVPGNKREGGGQSQHYGSSSKFNMGCQSQQQVAAVWFSERSEKGGEGQSQHYGSSGCSVLGGNKRQPV